jgi:transaldolase
MRSIGLATGMEIFLDSANVKEIAQWLAEGIVDGVTTNPSIIHADGMYDLERGAIKIAELVHPRPVSVEVTTNDRDEMLRQGRALAHLAENIVVKIPVINQFGESCLRVVRALTEEGIRVNVTACLSFGQAAMSTKAGATYVSLFSGRISDEGHDAGVVIRLTVDWLARWGYETRVIVGSIRQAYNIQEAALAGAHVITVPPQFLGKLLDHKYSRETVRIFVEDGQRALARMEAART